MLFRSRIEGLPLRAEALKGPSGLRPVASIVTIEGEKRSLEAWGLEVWSEHDGRHGVALALLGA